MWFSNKMRKKNNYIYIYTERERERKIESERDSKHIIIKIIFTYILKKKTSNFIINE